MKILMFNNEFPPLGGGTGTVNKELFNRFKHYPDITIDLITSASGNRKQTQNFSDNIRIIELPVGKKNIHHASNVELIRYAVKSSFTAFQLYKKQKYDLALVWTSVPSGLPALLLKLFKRTPYIVRIGGPDIPGFEERYAFIYKLISPFIKLIWKRAARIIVKCKSEKEMAEAFYPKISAFPIYNGADTDKYSPLPAPTKQHTPLKIICSGRLIKRKGQYTLIKALSDLKKETGRIINADFVGEGDETNKYKAYAKEKAVLEQISFSGYVPREEMPDKYRQADIFVLPSYNEGMSNALLEAMASGLPVVVTNVGGTEELVDTGNGYIFEAGNAEELKNILKEISENPERLKTMGENSRKRAKAFDWEKISLAYLKLFKDLVGHNSDNTPNQI
jgi:glycosyltransferase involved in cell wall biosynthesis